MYRRPMPMAKQAPGRSWAAVFVVFLFGFAAGATAGGIPRLVVPSGHTALVSSAAFSPDGRYLVSGGSDRRVVLWSVESGRELKSFELSGGVTAVDFAEDGGHVLALTGDRKLREWDVESGSVTTDIQDVFVYPLFSKAAYIPGTRMMAVGCVDSIELWNRDSGEAAGTLGEKLGVLKAMAVSPSGKYILAGGDEEKVFVFDRLSGKRRYTFSKHWNKVIAVAVSPDGGTAASASFSNKIRIWRLSDGKQIDKIKTASDGIYALAFSADGGEILSGHNDGAIERWSLETGDRVDRIEGHGKAVIHLAMGPDGRYFASAGADSTIKIWDTRNGALARTLKGRATPILSAAVDGDEALIGLADRSFRTIDLRRMKEGDRIADLPAVPYYMAASRDKGKILFQNVKQQAFLWDAGGTEPVMTFDDLADYSPVNAISPNGDSVALSTDDHRLKWYDTRTRKPENDSRLKETFWTGAAYSPDSGAIAAGTEDGRILIIDRKTGRTARTLTVRDVTVSVLAFSADGSLLLSGGRSGTVRLHDLKTGGTVHEMAGHRRMVETLSFSPDGRHALSGGYDGKIVLWDMESGKAARTFKGHGGSILGASFLSRKNRLVSVGRDGVIKYWDIESGKELASMVLIGARDWVAVTPDGRFDGTTEGILNLHYELDMKTLPLDSFFERYYTPRLLAGILEGAGPKAAPEAPSLEKGVALPPEVEILDPRPGQVMRTPEISVSISVTPRESGLDEIRIYHNGKQVESEARGLEPVQRERALRRSIRLSAVPGENEIRATALNRDRIESDPAVVRFEVRTAPRGSDLHVLAVGINAYKNATYNLNYGRPDAEAFVEMLKKKGGPIFGKIRATMVTDADATRPTIESAFQAIGRDAKAEDVFVFFYAGHGVMSEPEGDRRAEYYLALHDVTQLYGMNRVLAEKGLSAGDLKTLCVSVPARKQLLVVDACQAGGAVEAFAFRGAAEQRAIAQLARSAGLVVMASSGTEQFASEFSQLGHGVFTYALLRGLQGEADGGRRPDGKITIKELEAFLNDRVPELTEKYRGSPQYPNSYARGNDFPLAVR